MPLDGRDDSTSCGSSYSAADYAARPEKNIIVVNRAERGAAARHHPRRNHVQSLAAPRSDAREPAFRQEVWEIAQGERIRFTSSEREAGVLLGDLGTVTRIGPDRSMTVQLDSGTTAELSPEKTRRIDYGYAVDSSQKVRADCVLATGDQLSQRSLRGISSQAGFTVYDGSAAALHDAVSITIGADSPQSFNSHLISALITALASNASKNSSEPGASQVLEQCREDQRFLFETRSIPT